MTKMSEVASVALSLLAGFLLGGIFFGGLWWTIRKGLSAKSPALLFLGSLLLRTSLTITGFYFVAGADWRRLSACLLGFLIARVFAARLAASPTGTPNVLAKGGRT
jgi:F1F0 ATPase subunit 2